MYIYKLTRREGLAIQSMSSYAYSLLHNIGRQKWVQIFAARLTDIKSTWAARKESPVWWVKGEKFPLAAQLTSGEFTSKKQAREQAKALIFLRY